MTPEYRNHWMLKLVVAATALCTSGFHTSCVHRGSVLKEPGRCHRWTYNHHTQALREKILTVSFHAEMKPPETRTVP